MYIIIEKQCIAAGDEASGYFDPHHASIFEGLLQFPVKSRRQTHGWLGLPRNWSLTARGSLADLFAQSRP